MILPAAASHAIVARTAKRPLILRLHFEPDHDLARMEARTKCHGEPIACVFHHRPDRNVHRMNGSVERPSDTAPFTMQGVPCTL